MSSIRADIELNAAPFIGGIAKVQRQIRNLQAAAAGITATFLAARAAIAGLSGVFSEMKGALDLGGQLSDLSASTGASVSELGVSPSTGMTWRAWELSVALGARQPGASWGK